ncbi:thermonuclease NucI [Staphylococcus edaphicus]|uniref:Thermonuclease n=1 Tax=Staphylococcus edaphicus TaxID=1955013 RepID=A0A2C6U5N8_9STAP|nr:thermonuclease family protein [Staphylococcus edaphicus]PHK49172.1 thermonuclease [Staphylococcus edaphicus]UQW80540.1 thermonuclease family protein [Staphylococcus edaphicus]
MNSKKTVTSIIVIVVILGVLAFQYVNQTGPFQNNAVDTSSAPQNTEKVHVTRVVDGDTLVAQNGRNEQLKVRLIGVDTPETVKPNTPVQPYGKEASDYTKAQLTNKDVYLEYDKEKEDRYGRTLAYVWIGEKTMFNEQLVKKGLAREKYYSPNGKYRDVFEKAEDIAKEKHVNIWS